jgi:hydroxymethylbilane synthase
MIEPYASVDIVHLTTTGDRIQDRPLHDLGGKGLFTKELEVALLEGRIDVAVHSMKDVPVTMPLVDVAKLMIAAIPEREDPRDALVCRVARSIDALPHSARVGTGSLRRREQLLEARPDLVVEPVRGNIDTRLRKLDEGAFDAIILASAGLRRAGLFDPIYMTIIEVDQMVPAAGQGALAIQCRSDDQRVVTLLQNLDDPTTRRCVELEREVVRLLGCDCHSPIGLLAQPVGDQLLTHAAWHDGRRIKKMTYFDSCINVHLAASSIATGLSDISA